MSRREKGFSLIELLIVVAIILIIAAIAIPSLIRSKMAANESSAVSSVRTINTAAVTYSAMFNNGFAWTLALLTTPGSTCDASGLITDTSIGAGQKSGFDITYAGLNVIGSAGPGCGTAGGTGYVSNATPANLGTTGQRMFCSDESLVIRTTPGDAAVASDVACQALTALGDN